MKFVGYALNILMAFRLLGVPQAHAELMWGVNGHPLAIYPGTTYEQQLNYLVDLGATSYRVNIGNTKSGDELESLIAAANQRGISILPVVTPEFNLDKETATSLYKKSFDLAVAFVSRFKDKIRVWELGNELENYAILKPCELRDNGEQYNCAFGPAGGVSELDYYGPRWEKVSAVLKGLSDGTSSVDPTIKKAMGTAGWGHVGAFARMQKDGIRWDISVWHMYGQDPEWAFKTIAEYKHPIWITEFNHPLGSKEGEDKQADGLRHWMARLQELSPIYKVEAAHIYELMDETYWAPSFEAVMGLVHLDSDGHGGWQAGKLKPAYFAVRDSIRGNPPKPAATTVQRDPPTEGTSSPSFVPIRRTCDLAGYAKIGENNIRYRVAYAYCLVLGRGADGIGWNTYSRELANGRSVQELVLTLFASKEFRERNASALSPPKFVSLIYSLLLNRAPEPEVFANYVARLERGSLSQTSLESAIIGSREFRSKHPILFPAGTVTSATDVAPPPLTPAQTWRNCDLATLVRPQPLPKDKIAYGYCLVLGRYVDGGGSESYAKALESGSSISEVLTGLAGSEEFTKKLANSKLDDTEFVTLLYSLFLDRAPEKSALTSNLTELQAGRLMREQLISALMASAEFRAHHPTLYPNS